MPGRQGERSDAEMLRLFRSDGERAWQLFLDRYGARLLGYFRALEGDPDRAMDRFVALCERLRDRDFRRLREIEHVGERGELVPWLLAAAKNVAVDRTRAELGRRRLPKAVQAMSPLDQRVFELYFWRGLRPSELGQELGLERNRPADPIEVFDSLERLFECLDGPRLWRLVAQRSRSAEPAPLEPQDASGAPSQEAAMLRRERVEGMRDLLAALPVEDRVLLRLRYAEGLAIDDLARQVRLEPAAVRRALRRARRAARSLYAQQAAVDPGAPT